MKRTLIATAVALALGSSASVWADATATGPAGTVAQSTGGLINVANSESMTSSTGNSSPQANNASTASLDSTDNSNQANSKTKNESNQNNTTISGNNRAETASSTASGHSASATTGGTASWTAAIAMTKLQATVSGNTVSGLGNNASNTGMTSNGTTPMTGGSGGNANGAAGGKGGSGTGGAGGSAADAVGASSAHADSLTYNGSVYANPPGVSITSPAAVNSAASEFSVTDTTTSKTFVNATVDAVALNWATTLGAATGGYNLTVWRTPANVPTSQAEISMTVVPEPETYLLMLSGLGMVGLMTRRRRPEGVTQGAQAIA